VKIVRSRNGDSNVVHDFDVGDDFFSNLQVRFSPTLTLAASSGISVNTGSNGPRIANNTNLTLSKIWQTASLSAGLRKGLTPSFGVSGISDTTSMLSNLNIRPTERISVNSGVDFSLFDTEDVDFKTFQANIGMQYFITSWLSSNLGYSFRWVDRGSSASDVTLLDRGIVRGNLVFLSLTLNFDIWPNTGLARSITEPSSIPMIRTPFPSTPSATVAP
jgi:hypothetical protein